MTRGIGWPTQCACAPETLKRLITSLSKTAVCFETETEGSIFRRVWRSECFECSTCLTCWKLHIINDSKFSLLITCLFLVMKIVSSEILNTTFEHVNVFVDCCRRCSGVHTLVLSCPTNTAYNIMSPNFGFIAPVFIFAKSHNFVLQVLRQRQCETEFCF